MDATPDRERVERDRLHDGNGHDERRGEAVLTEATPAEDVRTVLINRVTWSAVFAGVAVSLVTQLLLNMLGIGVGLGTVDPASGATPALGSFGLGAGLWWAISGIVAAALGGYAAGRLSGRPERSTAAWHGLVSWAFATLAVFYLLTTTVSQIVGGTVTTAANVAGGAGVPGVRAVVPAGVTQATQAAAPFTVVEQQFRADTGDQTAARDMALSALRDLMTASTANQPAARERAVQAVSRALNVPPDTARQRIAFYEQQYQQAQAARAAPGAAQTAETAAQAVSWSMIGATIALVLGALAAWWAGGSAAVHPTITSLARSVGARRVVADRTTQ